MDRLSAAGWFEYDPEARVIFLPRQIEYDKPDNQFALKARIRRTRELPDSHLLSRYLRQLEPYVELYALTATELQYFRECIASTVSSCPTNPLPDGPAHRLAHRPAHPHPVGVAAPEPEPDTDPQPQPETEPDPEPTHHRGASIPYNEIIADLNSVTGRTYRLNTPATLRLIKARWAEGFRLEDFRKVHRTKFAEWNGDPEFRNYLRPETLYSPKFESYLNQPTVAPPRSEAARHNLSVIKNLMTLGGDNGNRS
ncbi:MAG: conserved phage C-terminal domain-containing protein [candidate division Zixibacteria bacterium]|nr:conserved phage C-terminal domain-containing protein [candidate division Zixibacteria bacterium]